MESQSNIHNTSDKKTHETYIEDGKKKQDALYWLQCFWPHIRIATKTDLMEKQNFPIYVQEYIETNWVHVNNQSGGTYVEPNYHDSHFSKNTNQHIFEKVSQNMDEYNKKAFKVMCTQPMEKAVEYMFTHPQTGKPMSYGEMRHFYG